MRMLVVVMLLSGCRYLVAPTPTVSPERPALLSGGNPTDPSRQPSELPSRRCVVACGVGFHCDERTAQCEPDQVSARGDGGVSWLP
jgi:hypothetical protein